MKTDNKKKRFTGIIISGLLLVTTVILIDKNRRQAGIISNQQIQIDGLLKQVKNLSYQLGKKTFNQ